MRRSCTLAVFVLLVVGLTAFLAACGGGGGGEGGGGVTAISTTSQGAQATAASVNTSRSVITAGVSLSNIASGGFGQQALKMRVPGGATAKTIALNKFAARFGPVVKKARTMQVSAQGFPMTTSCDSQVTGTVAAGSPNSITIDMDAGGTQASIVYNQCRELYSLTNGTFIMSNIGQNTATLTIGSDTTPFTEKLFSSSTATVPDSRSETSATMSLSMTGTAPSLTATMSMSGWFENWDYVLDTHDRQDMAGVSITATSSTATISGANYDVQTLIINGSMSNKTYSTAAGTSFVSESSSFTNFAITGKFPASGSAGNEYLTMNGTFSINTGNACIDGTFSIATNTDILIDSLGVTQAGKMTINGNAVVTFLTNGSVSVSVGGAAPVTYTESELSALCPL